MVVTAVLQSKQPTLQMPEKLLTMLENYAPLLPNLPYADWLLEPRQKLAELHIEGCLYVARTYLTRAELAQAVIWGRRTVDAAPWLEEAYQLLLRAYARQGQRTLALRIYDEAVANLQDELNLSPSSETETPGGKIAARRTDLVSGNRWVYEQVVIKFRAKAQRRKEKNLASLRLCAILLHCLTSCSYTSNRLSIIRLRGVFTLCQQPSATLPAFKNGGAVCGSDGHWWYEFGWMKTAVYKDS